MSGIIQSLRSLPSYRPGFLGQMMSLVPAMWRPEGAEDDRRSDDLPDHEELSKTARKRAERWEKIKAHNKARRQEVKRRKKAQKQQERELGVETFRPNAPNIYPHIQTDVRVIIDCSFEELMNEKELKSLASQLVRCYSENKKASMRTKLHFSSLNGHTREYMNIHNIQNWEGVSFSPEHYSALGIQPSDLVYLTSDSPNLIEQFEDGKTYVIGGIVDKNRHKNHCFNYANSNGLVTGRLPIKESGVKTEGRLVLTVNQVYEIILSHIETQDWATAITTRLPKRRLAGSKDVKKRPDITEALNA